jgi:hypothetical protein
LTYEVGNFRLIVEHLAAVSQNRWFESNPLHRRRALAAERKTQRPNRDATAALWPSQRSAWTASVPLPAGPVLIVILLLSLGLWAMIGAAISLIISALS